MVDISVPDAEARRRAIEAARQSLNPQAETRQNAGATNTTPVTETTEPVSVPKRGLGYVLKLAGVGVLAAIAAKYGAARASQQKSPPPPVPHTQGVVGYSNQHGVGAMAGNHQGLAVSEVRDDQVKVGSVNAQGNGFAGEVNGNNLNMRGRLGNKMVTVRMNTK